MVVEDLATMPGRSDLVVASLRNLSTSPSHAGVWAFVDGARLPVHTPDHTGPERIASTGENSLFGYLGGTPSRHYTLTLDPTGVTSSAGVAGPIVDPVDIEHALGRIYSTSGKIVDPATFEQLGTFGASGHIEVTADGVLTVVSDSSDLVSTFDAESGQLLESRSMPGVPPSTGLVASSAGFALSGPGGTTLLGDSVTAAGYVAPDAPGSRLSELAQISLPFRVNALLLDEPRDLLYVSVASNSSTRADEVVAVDPSTGAVVDSVWVGSNPGPMAISDDGTRLHVGLTTTGRIASLDLDGLDLLGSFSLGNDTDGRMFVANDLVVRPGQPDQVIVVLRTTSIRGVSLYIGGTRMPTTSERFHGPTQIEVFDDTTLYGIGPSSADYALSRLTVSDAGVERTTYQDRMIYGLEPTPQIFEGLMYTSTQEVIDPAAPALVGSLPALGPTSVDRAGGSVFTATRSAEQIVEVDRQTLRTVAVLDLPFENEPKGLVATTDAAGRLRLAVADTGPTNRGRLVLLVPARGRMHPVAPSRLADTRTGLGVPVGRVPAGGAVAVDVTGMGGLPSTGVGAVVVNLTSVGSTTAGHLTAWATGEAKPSTSNVNFRAGQVVANQAIVPVGADGTISIANSAGATHVVVDVQGWFGDGSEDGGSRLNPVAPARLADSRAGLGIPPGRLGGGASASLDVTGVGGVPASGVAAVVVNVTAVGATSPTHLTLWASGATKPATSNLNVAAGQVVANQAIVPVGADGRIRIANNAGATHVIVDVQGWFGDGGALLHTVAPARIADSRTGVGVPTGRVPAGGTIVVGVTGVAGVPATGAVAVVVNLTVTGSTASSHLTVWPTGQAKPGTSNLNFAAGQVVANQAIVPVGADGTISIANAFGATHVVVDVQGWFAAG